MNKNEENDYNVHGFGTNQESLIISENIVMNGKQGHGFAAEKSNNLIDKIYGNDAKIIGGDNAKNGADRLVNGIEIQSKYCKTGAECIDACFDKAGEFRYINSKGQPMVIEVPADKYDEALKTMAKKISDGKIQGVYDPKKASDYVKKGKITYLQAKNIAKAGNFDSILFDSVNGAITTSLTMGLSVLVSFGTSVWNGELVEKATEKACYTGLSVGGVTFISTVISSQIARGGEQALRGASNSIVNMIGKDGTTLITNVMNGGKNIYGAAAKNNLSKLIRGNIITNTVTTAILSSVDIYRLIDGKISGGQAFKNIMSIAASVGGGTLGWIGGAALGATLGTFIPGLGNIAGALLGIAGSILGAGGAAKLTDSVLSKFIENDFSKMLKLFEHYVKQVAEEYLLQENEIKILISEIQKIESIDKKMMELYKTNEKREFSLQLINPILKKILMKRTKIIIPEQISFLKKIDEILSSNDLFKLREIPFYDNETANINETIVINEILEEYRNIYGVEGKKIDEIISKTILYRHERLLILLEQINLNNSLVSSDYLILNLNKNFNITRKKLADICYKNIREIFSLNNKDFIVLLKENNKNRMLKIEDLVLKKTEECYEFALNNLKEFFKEEEEYIDNQIRKLSTHNIKMLMKNIAEKEKGIEVISGDLNKKSQLAFTYANIYFKLEFLEKVIK